MLPSLEKFSLLMPDTCFSAQHVHLLEGHRFWLEALISNTLEELVFDKFCANLDVPFCFLQTFFSHCHRINRLELRQWGGHGQFWTAVTKCKPPQNVRTFHLEVDKIDQDIISWISKMPKLDKLALELSHDRLGNLIAACPSGSLTVLKSLFINAPAYQWLTLNQLWHTPIVSHLNQLSICLPRPRNSNLGHIGRFFASLAVQSPNIYHLNINSMIGYALSPVTQVPANVLSNLRLPSLRTFWIKYSIASHSLFETIGPLWPDLEDLRLSSTVVELPDLLRALVYYPRLRQLHIQLQPRKITHEALSTTLAEYMTYSTHPHSATLTVEFNHQAIRTRHSFRYDLEDMDVLARYVFVILVCDVTEPICR
jgi:hypothetical protein